MTYTFSQYRIDQKKASKSKMKNKICRSDDIKFDSLAEMAYYERLKLLKLAGEVSHFLMQVPFNLPGGVRYRLDFLVFYTDGHLEHVDIKGYATDTFKLKKKQVEALYPIEIICLARKGRNFVKKEI